MFYHVRAWLSAKGGCAILVPLEMQIIRFSVSNGIGIQIFIGPSHKKIKFLGIICRLLIVSARFLSVQN